MATPFFSLPSSRPDPNPNPTPGPKHRGRKNGSKSQNVNKEKTRRRGVGIAELERLRHLDEQSPPSPCTTTTNPITETRVSPFHHSNSPLSGVPVIRCCLPGQPIHDPRLAQRVDPSSSLLSSSELPSMPNPFQSNLSFKKKRVIGDEEIVGFTKGYNGNFSGFDLKNRDNNYNGGFSAQPTTSNGSEVVAIHRKWSGAGNVMMEYGFFPGKSTEEEINNNNNNNNNNNDDEQQHNMKFDYKMEDLNLKMGFSDSSIGVYLSSPSSSSSLSSLTTSTTNTSVDLSLKLSFY